jgi:predicted TIM-barrel fold metal-dependent hydrolase
MRIVAVEEHFTFPDLLGRIDLATLDQVWVSTSGFSSTAAFLAAFMTFGADRILFSVDYPFGNNLAAVAFLKNLPVSPEDRQKIAHQNADALLGLRSSR